MADEIKLPPLPEPDIQVHGKKKRTISEASIGAYMTETVDRLRREAVEAYKQQQGEAADSVSLAVIGKKHFGNPIPREWYAAAKELLSCSAPAQPLTDEQERALCEAYCNTASDEYFKARPQIESDVSRRIFYAGHRKAWIEWESAHNIGK